MYIATTRFNPNTLEEHTRWCLNNDVHGCIINSPTPMCPKIPKNELVCVIHMLNLNPKQHNGCSGNIVGISFVKNQPMYDHNENYGLIFDNFKIYSDGNYNRYTYLSPYYIPINNDSKIVPNQQFILELEALLFYGKGHMKRGHGISLIKTNNLSNDTLNSLKTLCKTFENKIKLNYND